MCCHLITTQETLAARGTTEAWKTAVLYQLVHAVAILSLPERGNETTVKLWTAGVTIFSGSIYGERVPALGHSWSREIFAVGFELRSFATVESTTTPRFQASGSSDVSCISVRHMTLLRPVADGFEAPAQFHHASKRS